MSSASKRLREPHRFLTDECLANRVPAGLHARGWDVTPFSARYDRGLADVDWLPLAARDGFVVLSKDGRITQRRNETDAIIASGCAAFLLGRGNLTADDMVEAFHRARAGIYRILADHDAPFIAGVTSLGRVELRIDHTGARATKPR